MFLSICVFHGDIEDTSGDALLIWCSYVHPVAIYSIAAEKKKTGVPNMQNESKQTVMKKII